MRQLPYREGTWFALPLTGGGFGVGIIARVAPKGKIILSYLFGPKRIAAPALSEVEGLESKDAVLKIRVSTLGLIQKEWPVVGQSKSWDRSAWPMPVFIRREPFGRGRAWLVYYPDDDPNGQVAESPAPFEYPGLQRDSLFGSGAAEIILTKALAGK